MMVLIRFFRSVSNTGAEWKWTANALKEMRDYIGSENQTIERKYLIRKNKK